MRNRKTLLEIAIKSEKACMCQRQQSEMTPKSKVATHCSMKREKTQNGISIVQALALITRLTVTNLKKMAISSWATQLGLSVLTRLGQMIRTNSLINAKESCKETLK